MQKGTVYFGSEKEAEDLKDAIEKIRNHWYTASGCAVLSLIDIQLLFHS